jgi:hypothetical protein
MPATPRKVEGDRRQRLARVVALPRPCIAASRSLPMVHQSVSMRAAQVRSKTLRGEDVLDRVQVRTIGGR